MGVKGLTSFLEEVQATVFQTIKLSNQCFVIDGFSLAWFLYLQENLDIRLVFKEFNKSYVTCLVIRNPKFCESDLTFFYFINFHIMS